MGGGMMGGGMMGGGGILGFILHGILRRIINFLFIAGLMGAVGYLWIKLQAEKQRNAELTRALEARSPQQMGAQGFARPPQRENPVPPPGRIPWVK